jgi:hypothetical protein
MVHSRRRLLMAAIRRGCWWPMFRLTSCDEKSRAAAWSQNHEPCLPRRDRRDHPLGAPRVEDVAAVVGDDGGAVDPGLDAGHAESVGRTIAPEQCPVRTSHNPPTNRHRIGRSVRRPPPAAELRRKRARNSAFLSHFGRADRRIGARDPSNRRPTQRKYPMSGGTPDRSSHEGGWFEAYPVLVQVAPRRRNGAPRCSRCVAQEIQADHQDGDNGLPGGPPPGWPRRVSRPRRFWSGPPRSRSPRPPGAPAPAASDERRLTAPRRASIPPPWRSPEA